MRKEWTRREFLALMTAGALTPAAGKSARGNPEEGARTMPDQALPVTNDTAKPQPKTDIAAAMLTFDFPALHIGVAEYAEGPTGCTVFYFPRGALCAADVRGGSAGTFLAGDGGLDALCYAGGSLYGLEASAGVAAELFAKRNYSANWMDIALVRGAIIYDYPPRRNAIYPDKELGRAALRAARPGRFPLGPHGAGISATVGKGFDFNEGEAGGQGGAFRQVGPTKIAVFSIVNAIGAIHDRRGQVVRGHLDRRTGKRHTIVEDLERRLAAQEAAKPPSGNTTLTAVVTNQKLDPRSLGQIAKQVHASMCRVIQPFHCLEDGDTLYAISTGEVENPSLNATALGVLASELAWDAVLNCCAK
jgi:L-aminopeptidase/D-esterase-like protein